MGILKVFKLFDDDSTGKISFKNLKRMGKELGENMTEEELQDMIDQADRDGDGEINPDEFYRIMKDTKEEILKVFKLFDDDSTGKISFKNLKRVAKELGENMTEEE